MPRRQVPLALPAHCSLNRLAERALGPVAAGPALRTTRSSIKASGYSGGLIEWL